MVVLTMWNKALRPINRIWRFNHFYLLCWMMLLSSTLLIGIVLIQRSKLQHSTLRLDNRWIVIFGEYYNGTPWQRPNITDALLNQTGQNRWSVLTRRLHWRREGRLGFYQWVLFYTPIHLLELSLSIELWWHTTSLHNLVTSLKTSRQ